MLRRQIVLTHVHSVGPERESHVDPVVDDHSNSKTTSNGHHFETRAVEISRRSLFVTQLNERRPSGGQPLDLIAVRQPAQF